MIDILYIEDDELDVQLARSALEHVCSPGLFNLSVVDDGEKALQFLKKHEPYEKTAFPDIVLLDLNLPKVQGRDILRFIKETSDLKKIPVIVLTTSQLQEDIDASYTLGANGYLTKPSELAEYRAKFKAICDFWIGRASLPTKSAHATS
jgi:two-component system response regulator